ncbi:hypothetical protein AAFC00_003484 [Neodothiora populina]|uniref:GYF domain-containing protein n=1 Tax=Neodothiora populina TaxID=2781224 RepID=A0ABR3PFH9_9PEZI
MTGKRHAEAHARYQPDSSSSIKKPRFDYRNPSTLAPDASEEDAILELDEIGKGGQQTKRNAVKLDGYDTDSSEENFDTRAEEKARLAKQSTAPAAASKDEEELDMFADMDEGQAGGAQGDGDDDEEVSREGKKGSKKAVRFMEINEIEGQVHSSKSGGHVSADFNLINHLDKGKQREDVSGESSSESGDDEERDRLDTLEVDDDRDAAELGAGSKKKHAPKLDAFNMEQEGQEGRFDESGNFIRKAADPDAVHDAWMDGLGKKDMKKAREAQEKRDALRREKLAADDALLNSDLLSTLISHLEVGETVLEALQRLQSQAKPKAKPKKVPKWKQKKQQKTNDDNDTMDIDGTETKEEQKEDPAETRRKAIVEEITGAADALFSRDQQDIYDKEREVLMRAYKRETGDDWVPSASASEPIATSDDHNNNRTNDQPEAQWEYRWADGRDPEGKSYGSYDAQTMRAWNDAGYFGQGVEFRRVGEDAWRSEVEFL